MEDDELGCPEDWITSRPDLSKQHFQPGQPWSIVTLTSLCFLSLQAISPCSNQHSHYIEYMGPGAWSSVPFRLKSFRLDHHHLD